MPPTRDTPDLRGQPGHQGLHGRQGGPGQDGSQGRVRTSSLATGDEPTERGGHADEELPHPGGVEATSSTLPACVCQAAESSDLGPLAPDTALQAGALAEQAHTPKHSAASELHTGSATSNGDGDVREPAPAALSCGAAHDADGDDTVRMRGGMPGNVGFDENGQGIPGRDTGGAEQHMATPPGEGLRQRPPKGRAAAASDSGDDHGDGDDGDDDEGGAPGAAGASAKVKSRNQARQRRHVAKQVMETMSKEIETLTAEMAHMHHVLDAARYDTRAITSARGGGQYVTQLSDHRNNFEALLVQADCLVKQNSDSSLTMETANALESEYREVSRVRLEATREGHTLIALDPTFLSADQRVVCWMGEVSLACQLAFFLALHSVPEPADPRRHGADLVTYLDHQTAQQIRTLLAEVRENEGTLTSEFSSHLKAQLCSATAQNLAHDADRWMRTYPTAHGVRASEAGASQRSDQGPQWQQPLIAAAIPSANVAAVEATADAVLCVLRQAEDLRINTLRVLRQILPLPLFLHFHCARTLMLDVIDTINSNREPLAPPQKSL